MLSHRQFLAKSFPTRPPIYTCIYIVFTGSFWLFSIQIFFTDQQFLQDEKSWCGLGLRSHYFVFVCVLCCTLLWVCVYICVCVYVSWIFILGFFPMAFYPYKKKNEGSKVFATGFFSLGGGGPLPPKFIIFFFL